VIRCAVFYFVSLIVLFRIPSEIFQYSTSTLVDQQPPKQPSLKSVADPRKHNRRKPKYRNRAVFITPGGVIVGREYPGEKTKVADSEKEYRRELVLRADEAAGRIIGLRKQVKFKLYGRGGTAICSYVADFVYLTPTRQIVEDVKSKITRKLRVYRIKKKLMKDNYGITIAEV
jgi:hypothetical protein